MTGRVTHKSKAKMKQKPSGFSTFQIVSVVVCVGLSAVLMLHLAPAAASLIVSGCIVAGTYALQASGRI